MSTHRRMTVAQTIALKEMLMRTESVVSIAVKWPHEAQAILDKVTSDLASFIVDNEHIKGRR